MEVEGRRRMHVDDFYTRGGILLKYSRCPSAVTTLGSRQMISARSFTKAR